MFVSFSFANGLCLVLTTILLFELCQRASEVTSSAGTSGQQYDLEWTYCRNPVIEASRRSMLTCTSAHQLFVTLANDCARTRKRKLVLKPSTSQSTYALPSKATPEKNCSERGYLQKSITLDADVRINNEDEDEERDDEDEDERETVSEEVKIKNETMSLADIIVTSLLAVLGAVIISEIYRETIARYTQGGETGGSDQTGHEGSRRLSLADLTVMRHARRRESQQLEHQFRSSTGKRPPPLLRRSSFPAQLISESHHRQMPQRQQSWNPSSQVGSSRRLSMDMSEDDSSPDRRRVRLIRRR